jgi:hypothetical protein
VDPWSRNRPRACGSKCSAADHQRPSMRPQAPPGVRQAYARCPQAPPGVRQAPPGAPMRTPGAPRVKSDAPDADASCDLFGG